MQFWGEIIKVRLKEELCQSERSFTQFAQPLCWLRSPWSSTSFGQASGRSKKQRKRTKSLAILRKEAHVQTHRTSPSAHLGTARASRRQASPHSGSSGPRNGAHPATTSTPDVHLGAHRSAALGARQARSGRRLLLAPDGLDAKALPNLRLTTTAPSVQRRAMSEEEILSNKELVLWFLVAIAAILVFGKLSELTYREEQIRKATTHEGVGK